MSSTIINFRNHFKNKKNKRVTSFFFRGGLGYYLNNTHYISTKQFVTRRTNVKHMSIILTTTCLNLLGRLKYLIPFISFIFLTAIATMPITTDIWTPIILCSKYFEKQKKTVNLCITHYVNTKQIAVQH